MRIKIVQHIFFLFFLRLKQRIEIDFYFACFVIQMHNNKSLQPMAIAIKLHCAQFTTNTKNQNLFPRWLNFESKIMVKTQNYIEFSPSHFRLFDILLSCYRLFIIVLSYFHHRGSLFRLFITVLSCFRCFDLYVCHNDP